MQSPGLAATDETFQTTFVYPECRCVTAGGHRTHAFVCAVATGVQLSVRAATVTARGGRFVDDVSIRISKRNGHCNSPIAGYPKIDGVSMSLTASVLDECGDGFMEVTRSVPADCPRELGRAVGLELLDKGAAEISARTRPEL